jgi:hypothetical protein
MHQLLVECSEPGLVIHLAEEFEHSLRHVDFDRAWTLRQQLTELAQECGPEFYQVWQGFRLEVPNDGGWPPSFGKREMTTEEIGTKEVLQEFLSRAEAHGLGEFRLRSTMLLPQDGPAPETREQYVRDLADGIRMAQWEELGLFRFPVDLPVSMIQHRKQLAEEWGGSVLHARAHHPDVGQRWVEESLARLRKALEQINTRSEAVMEYELDRLDPVKLDAVECIRWAAVAVRLGHGIEKWFQAAVEPLAYLYQRAALVSLLWTECRGIGQARPVLEECLEAVVEEAEGTYTADGVAALRRLQGDLRQTRWGSLRALTVDEDKDRDEDEGKSVAG